jgi:hypothetical protein
MKTSGSELMAVLLAVTLVCVSATPGVAQDRPGPAQISSAQTGSAIEGLLAGRFQWTIGESLVAPAERPEDPCYSVKDPSVVFHQGRWHLFLTIRSQKRSHQIEYLSFADWKEANSAPRHLLTMHGGFFCAPQVFYFAPQKKWYLICQASDKSWNPEYGAAYATTTDAADPASWSRLKPLGAKRAGAKAGLDFWIICDDQKAHLFFTTNDGHMWREETRLEDFPGGWSEAKLAIEGDIFEASHTYKLKGLDKYLTLVEAQGGQGWRYYKAYLADQLEGPWKPLAATKDKTFASMANARPVGPRWTDSISHGELLRSGVDQCLEVDPAHLRFLFQGVSETARAGKPYGQIPWRLGILESASSAGPPDAPAPSAGKKGQAQESGWERIWADKTVDAAIRGRVAAVDPQRMSKDLFYLSKDPLPYRKLNFTLPGHAKNTLYEADDYLAGRLESWGYRVEREGVRVQAFRRDASKPKHAQYSRPMPEDPWYTAFNLYAEKKGRTRPSEIILVCAHKDSQSWVDSPGANDNAIGTVSVLEMARVLAEYRSERTIRFLFCNEEHVPWTSVTTAASAKARGDNLVAVLNIDSVGAKTAADTAAGKKSNVTAYTAPEGKRLADLISAVNGRFALGLEQRVVKRTAPGDDDGSFVRAGYPAAIINIGSWPYGDPNYHAEGDIPERCDVANAAQAAQATLAAILTLDQER